jgi:hypothetical protein
MRFASTSHPGTVALRRFVVPIAITAMLGAALTGGLFAVVSRVHAAGPAPYAAARVLTPAGTSGSLTQSTAASARSNAIVKGARPLHGSLAAPALASQANAGASAADSPLHDQQGGKLLSNFNGVSSRDSGDTNFGAEFEPPDQGLCVGNGFVVEPVNSAYSIYRTNGKLVAGPFNVNVLFGEGLTEFTSDPRCYFDKTTNTWFAVILFIATTPDGNFGDNARTDIAVNTSGDPTTPWTVYHIDATDDGTNGTPNHAGCPCLGDQPRLGIDSHNLYISTDEFSILGPEFNGTQIYAVSKKDLVHHASTIHFVQFDNLSIGGDIAFGVQPAITNGYADAEYFLNSLDPNGTTDNRLGVWALTGGEKVSQGGMPKLSHVVIHSETYGIPPAAAQKGSTSTLDSGDDRMQQVQFIGGNLWGALGTVLTPQGDTTSRAGAAWFKVAPHLNGKVIGGADVRAQGYVASRGNYLLYPAIQANRDGAAAIVVTLTGAGTFPSAAYTVMQSGQHGFGSVQVAARGKGSYDPNATRWGDYSWAVLDPDHNTFWMATEYIPPTASQTQDGLRNWGTRVIQIAA